MVSDRAVCHIVNIGSAVQTSILEIAQMVKKFADKEKL
jgi:hypothetical protein